MLEPIRSCTILPGTQCIREAFKKKIKSVDFFHTGAGGSTLNPHFFKSVDFQGGVGGLGSNFNTFLSNFFLKNFVLFYPVFVGWKVRKVWKKSTLFIFFLKASLMSPTTMHHDITGVPLMVM